MAFLSRLFKRGGSLRPPVVPTTGSNRSSTSNSDDDAPPTMTGMLSAPADLGSLGYAAPRRMGTSDRSAVSSRRGGEIRRSLTYTAGSTFPQPSAATTQTSARPSVSSCDGVSMDDRLRQQYGKLRQTHVGRRAVILEGVDRRTKQPVVIKAYSRLGMTASMYEQLERERGILRTAADCPGVVRLLDHLEDQANTYVVLEHVPGYTLIELMAQSGGRIQEARCVHEVVAPLLRTLSALHALGIVHRDIKPEHIICSFGGVKLVDFAHAAQQRHQCLNHRVGQLEYMAPEVLDKPTAADIFHQVLHQGMSEGELPQYDEKADVWSLGCVVYEALTGQQPFMAESAAELSALHNSLLATSGPDGAPLLLQHPCISDPARDFLVAVLQVDPQVRPSALHLLQHPWVLQHTGAAGAGQDGWLLPPSAHGSVHGARNSGGSARGGGGGGSHQGQGNNSGGLGSGGSPSPTAGQHEQQHQQHQQQHYNHHQQHQQDQYYRTTPGSSSSVLPDPQSTSGSNASTQSSLSAEVLAVAAVRAAPQRTTLPGCCMAVGSRQHHAAQEPPAKALGSGQPLQQQPAVSGAQALPTRPGRRSMSLTGAQPAATGHHLMPSPGFDALVVASATPASVDVSVR